MLFGLDLVCRFRLESGCRRLWKLGPRPLAEFLLEVVVECDDLSALLDRLDDYATHPRETIDILGGCDFPPRPFHLVPTE